VIYCARWISKRIDQQRCNAVDAVVVQPPSKLQEGERGAVQPNFRVFVTGHSGNESVGVDRDAIGAEERGQCRIEVRDGGPMVLSVNAAITIVRCQYTRKLSIGSLRTCSHETLSVILRRSAGGTVGVVVDDCSMARPGPRGRSCGSCDNDTDSRGGMLRDFLTSLCVCG
jgi:hypothetical protein